MKWGRERRQGQESDDGEFKSKVDVVYYYACYNCTCTRVLVLGIVQFVVGLAKERCKRWGNVTKDWRERENLNSTTTTKTA
jgi:hypothetical protein